MIEGEKEILSGKEWEPTGERILITGFSGLVGFGIVRAALGKDRLVGVSRGNLENLFSGDQRLEAAILDLLDKDSLFLVIKECDPSLIIHLAGATDIDKCQQEPDWARALNIETTKNLVDACLYFGKPLIHFSTDYVFPRLGGPFSEADEPAPLTDKSGEVVNIYGKTKREGEKIVENLHDNKRIIIRIASPYNQRYQKKPGTPPTLLKLLKEGKPIKAVYDAETTYTYGPDIAIALNQLILERIWERKNIVHIAGPRKLSALDIVKITAKHFPASKVESVFQDEYFSNRAPRPLERGLKTETLDEMGIKMRSWEEVLESEILRLPV